MIAIANVFVIESAVCHKSGSLLNERVERKRIGENSDEYKVLDKGSKKAQSSSQYQKEHLKAMHRMADSWRRRMHVFPLSFFPSFPFFRVFKRGHTPR